MKIVSKFFFILFFILALGWVSPNTVLANTTTLSGKILDSSGTIINGATIDVINTNTNSNAGTITTNSSGEYSLVLMEGTYNVQVTPPAGSSFSPVVTLSQNISTDKILNFILTPAGSVTFSGHV